MSASKENFSEVLNLIKRRKRATRSLQSLSELITKLVEAESAEASKLVLNHVKQCSERYGLNVTTGNIGTRELPEFVLKLPNLDLCFVTSLPKAVDEKREAIAVLDALNAVSRMIASRRKVEV